MTALQSQGWQPHAARSAPALDSFVGRQEQLAWLDALWQRALSGEGAGALIRGEPGIGKTRLVWQFAAQVRARGGRSVLAQAPGQAGAPALWPFIQVLRALLHEQLIGARDLAPLGAMFAPFLPEAAAQAVPNQLPQPASRFWLFDRITQLLQAAARRTPLCLVLEDLHALDPASLELAQHLLRALPGVPLLVIATCRDAELELPGGLVLSEIAAALPCSLQLRGLDEREVLEVLAGSLQLRAARSVAAEVHRRTEGNPLYVHALAPALAERSADELERGGALHLPESLRLAVARRLQDLPSCCRQLLRAAAVLGREHSRELLSETLVGQPSAAARVLSVAAPTLARPPAAGSLDGSLRCACRAGVLQRVPGERERYRFAHVLLVEILYAELSPHELAELHEAAARALEKRTSDRDPTARAQIARHWLKAGGRANLERACALAYEAAQAAQQRRAFTEAAGELLVALAALTDLAALERELDPLASQPELARRRATLLRELSAARFAAGELQHARDHLREVVGIARQLADTDLLAQAALDGLARDSLLEIPPEQLALCEEVCAVQEGDALARARVMAALGARLCGTPERARGLALIERAAELAAVSGAALGQLDVLEARHSSLLGVRPLAPRRQLLERWGELAAREGNPLQQRRVELWRMVAAIDAGDVAELDRLLCSYERRASDSGDLYSSWEALWLAGSRSLRSGRLAEAEQLMQRALELGQRAQALHAPGVFRLQLVQLRRLQGRAAETIPVLQLMAERFPHRKGARAMLAAVHAELGHRAEASSELARAQHECFEAIEQLPALHALCQLAYAAAELGDGTRASAVYEALLPFEAQCAAMSHGIVCDGSVALHLGLCARTVGGGQASKRALQHFERAIETNRSIGALPWLARTQYELARLLRAGERAQQLVQEALATSERLGLCALAQRARELLASLSQCEPEPAAAAEQFRREGELWSVRYAGRRLQLQDSLGMRYLALLLARPGRAFHVLDLIAEVCGSAAPVPGQADPATLPASERAGAAHEDVIDARTAQLYRARARSLMEELDSAREHADLGQIERKEAELSLLREQLIARIHPRHRPTERARKAVSNRIRAALTRIERDHPALARHLSASLKTGTHCEYRPERDPRWIT